MGGLAAYNTALLFYLALCGFAAFLLSRDLTDNALAGVLAALVYQNWPARLTRMNFPNLVNTACIPLSLLFLIRTLRRGRWYHAVLTGVFVALTAYARWQQLIPTAIVIGIYLIFAGIRQASLSWAGDGSYKLSQVWKTHRCRFFLLLLAGLVVALALLPPALTLIHQQMATSTRLIESEDEENKQTDLLAYLTPAKNHPLVGRWTRALHDQYYRGRPTFVSYVGLIPLTLVVVGVWKERHAALPWATAAVCLLLLGLGPILRVNGESYPSLPTLYRLADRALPLSLIRVPARFSVFLALPVAVLVGYGAVPVLAWARGRALWSLVLLSLLLGSIILFEYLVGPIPMERHNLSPYYDQLAAEPEGFGVLNVPIEEKTSKAYMFAQTRHGHPIMQGHVSRLPSDVFSTIDGQPWLRVLRQSHEMAPRFTDVSRQLSSLAQMDVKIIMLQKPQVGADRIAHWKRYLITDPFYEDNKLAAYTTEPLAGHDFALAEELVPGLGSIRIITSTDCLNPGRVLEVDVGWGTSAPPRQAFNVELALTSEERAVTEQQTYPLSPDWPTSEWPANAIAWGYYAFPFPSTLPTGRYTLRMALTDPATGVVQGKTAVLGTVVVDEEPCTFSTPSGAVGMNAVFGDELRLLGYERKRNGDYLLVKLHWRSEQRMETDYKVFVHVFDPETTRPVAQGDDRPHRGAYPTVFWGPGEVVEDAIPISLAEAPAGTYGLAVGVYDPATMERLAVTTSDGPHPDGRLELPGETVVIGGDGR
ncbi:MAG: hypothetical protein PVF54_10750, partial [Anaerolineae bacterium]|jgi:hypothetical protein